jgi:hypothetical protein
VSNSQCKKSTHPPVVPFLPSLSHSHGQATHRTSRTTSALCLPSASLWQPCLSALWQGRSPGGWRRWCIEKGDEGWWPSAAGGRTAGELDCDRSRRRDNGGPPSLQSPAAGLSHVEPASWILSPPRPLAPSRSCLAPTWLNLAAAPPPVAGPQVEECIAVGERCNFALHVAWDAKCVSCLGRLLEDDFDTRSHCVKSILPLGCHMG